MNPKSVRKVKVLKPKNLISNMINEWGGIIFSGFALIGASGMILNQFQIQSFLLMSFVGMIVFSMLWISSQRRKIHMFIASFFAGAYLIISYLYIGTNLLFAGTYFLFSIGTMIYAIKEIVDEKDN